MIIQKAFSQIKRTSKIENIPVESMYFKISVINDSGAEERKDSIVVGLVSSQNCIRKKNENLCLRSMLHIFNKSQ